jgi:hypothetical protein
LVSGSIDIDVLTSTVYYFTGNASADWATLVRGSSTVTLNSLLDIGDSITISYLITTGAAARRQTLFRIDGTTITPRWIGGAAPTAGFANSINIYTATIIKTANATFTVIIGLTRAA